jgi:hypothetical protein
MIAEGSGRQVMPCSSKRAGATLSMDHVFPVERNASATSTLGCCWATIAFWA